MVMRPASSNSSLRSFDRTSAVLTPRRSSSSSVSRISAPRGTASLSPSRLTNPRDVESLDVQRPAARGQVAAEAAQEVVVAAAAADRGAERRVVDLEDRARVVAERVDQPQIEDHALGRRGLEPVIHGPELSRLGHPVEHLGAPAQLWHAQQLVVAVDGNLALEPDA